MNPPNRDSLPSEQSPDEKTSAAGDNGAPADLTRLPAAPARQPSPGQDQSSDAASHAAQDSPTGEAASAASGDAAGLAATPPDHDEAADIATPEESLDVPAAGEVVTDVGLPKGEEKPTLPEKVKTLLVGKPRNLADQSVFRHVSLVAFLAWVGLGADGLSSSCYGPAEAFDNLGSHRYLAVFLAIATIITVLVISTCYRHIIEEFPSGGGGYLVASKLLGPRAGVVSGCALLIDYVLTIAVSIAAGGDALFGLLGADWAPWKLQAEAVAIIVLIVLNLRGVKESVMVLMPIFLVFLVTHAVLIGGAVSLHVVEGGAVVRHVSNEVRSGLANPQLGLWGMLALLLHAYSLGAGTYTGIEAVSNSMPVMREPRVATAKRTMLYMAFSLALTAGGLMLAYLLLDVRASEGKTLNLVLSEQLMGDVGLGGTWPGMAFIFVTILAEGALLFVAAQAGFIDGPRVLANMAHDSWMPHWFANLSERLATHNGIFLMGLSALAALLFTRGVTTTLIIMYSINVFVTFSLSMIGMCRHWFDVRGENPLWRRRLTLFVVGATMCVSILCVTSYEKFEEGGYVTLGATGILVAVCFSTNRYYRRVVARLRRLNETLGDVAAPEHPTAGPLNANQPTAAILVGGYSGLGVHTMLNAVRFAPGHFKNMVFLSVAVVDSGNFKGAKAVDALRRNTEESLERYVDLSRRLGLPAVSYMAIGTDAVDELEQLCVEIAKQFPKVIFFAGQLVFEQDSWYHRLLHNQTAFSLQRRLQWAGLPMVILPTRVR
jgi:amino acid transporter